MARPKRDERTKAQLIQRQYLTFGVKLLYWREGIRLLNLAQMAQRTGLQPETISKVEKGLARPNAATLDKMLAALGITREELAATIVPEFFRSVAAA